MKLKLILFTLSLTLLSCSETFQERAVRECNQFTERNCPKVTDPMGLRYDSLVFRPAKMERVEYYTLFGEMLKGDVSTYKEAFGEALVEAVRNDLTSLSFKKEKVTFRFIYTSGQSGEELMNFVVTPEEYR